MRILHVAAPAAFGGLERVIQLLGTGLAAAGHDVHVACVSGDAEASAAFVAPLTSAGVATHQIVVQSRGYARERAAIAAVCRRVRPDVVHTHGYRPDVLDAGVARRAGIPTVTTAHGFTAGPLRNRFYEYLQRRAFRRFDAVVAVSRPLGERLREDGVAPDRLHVIPNAWRSSGPQLDRGAARKSLGLDEDKWTIGWVGRLSEEKGPDVLIDALPALRDLPITVCIIGDGVDRTGLSARAARLHVADRIRWAGVVSHAERLYSAFDVCVLSSRTEGTPLVLFEAMAAGVPLVATSVGGVPDVVSAREAILVPSERPAALAAAIRSALDQPVAAAERARVAGVRLEQEFAVGPWVERYLAIYERVSRPATTPVAA